MVFPVFVERPDRLIEIGAVDLGALELAEHVDNQRRFDRQDFICLAIQENGNNFIVRMALEVIVAADDEVGNDTLNSA